MQNKSFQKTSSEIRSYKILKKKLRMMIINKSLHSSLTLFTSIRNLVYITLLDYTFNFVTKEFSTLHNLQNLVLKTTSNNIESRLEWLEETSFKSSLELLEMKNYKLPTSGLYIIFAKNFSTLHIGWSRKCFSNIKFDYSSYLILDLSHNNFGRFGPFGWKWLMQASIKNNLETLIMRHCHYLITLPIQISYMKNLQYLHLPNNKIEFVPKKFGTLSQLTELDLSRNLLGKSKHSTWEWLENSIKDSLIVLAISCNSLTEFPIQITYATNLEFLDISDNKIKFLPKELGNLPYLKYLNLTKNHLGTFNSPNAWEWLEQSSIKNNLLDLYLSENRLTHLPPQIGMLKALINLDLSGNKLKFLPQTIAHLITLRDLDLCDNDLLYLPGNMAHFPINLDVDNNPFNLEDDSDDLTTNSTYSKVPNLAECSAQVILNFSESTLNYVLSSDKRLFRYFLYERKYCSFCETPCFFYYGKRFIKFFEYNEIMAIKFSATSNIINANFECYACSPKCAFKLRKYKCMINLL